MSTNHEGLFGRPDEQKQIRSSVPRKALKQEELKRETVGGYQEPIWSFIKESSSAIKQAILQLIGK